MIYGPCIEDFANSKLRVKIGRRSKDVCSLVCLHFFLRIFLANRQKLKFSAFRRDPRSFLLFNRALRPARLWEFFLKKSQSVSHSLSHSRMTIHRLKGRQLGFAFSLWHIATVLPRAPTYTYRFLCGAYNNSDEKLRCDDSRSTHRETKNTWKIFRFASSCFETLMSREKKEQNRKSKNAKINERKDSSCLM